MNPVMTSPMPLLAVPGQALFQDPALAGEALARTLDGEIGPDRRISGVSASLRHGVPFKRSSFELELTIAHGPGAAPEKRRLLAKLYAKDHGPRAYEVLRDLRNHGFSMGPCRVPKPLGYDPTWRMLLLDWVPGTVLRTAILDGPDGLPTLAARPRAARHHHQQGIAQPAQNESQLCAAQPVCERARAVRQDSSAGSAGRLRWRSGWADYSTAHRCGRCPL